MDVCQRKAQEICGDKLVRPLQARAPLDRKTSTGTPDTNVLLFQCAAPAPVAQAAPRPAAGGPLPGPAPVMPKRITLGADATFDTARSVLKPAGLQRLDQLIHDAQGMSVGVATVNGYTDSVGSDGYNQALSQRRAEAVADYLRSHGLKVDRYVVRGYGKSDPVATNATAEGRARNRRVDVLLDRRM
jgi:outer membrane protein OmpA-like peptidoglycan-associated protein